MSDKKEQYKKSCESLVARMVGNFPGLREINSMKGHEVNGADLCEWISNEIHYLEETQKEQFLQSYYRRNQ
jgi:hypothetical protein